jgi:hypothetical protein
VLLELGGGYGDSALNSGVTVTVHLIPIAICNQGVTVTVHLIPIAICNQWRKMDYWR